MLRWVFGLDILKCLLFIILQCFTLCFTLLRTFENPLKIKTLLLLLLLVMGNILGLSPKAREVGWMLSLKLDKCIAPLRWLVGGAKKL